MNAITKISISALIVAGISFAACQKEISTQQQGEEAFSSAAVNANANSETPPFNIEVILRGEANGFGHVKFRQDNDVDKIIILDTWVRDLEPNHNYLLQRAVDPINVVDGNCTSTSWLTLGKGLTAQSILTDDKGTGRVELWRDVSSVASGARFDIHFQIIDAVSMDVVLTSDCYEYVVR
jgi:hypothetical protein